MKGDAEQHDAAAVLAAIERAQAAPDAGLQFQPCGLELAPLIENFESVFREREGSALRVSDLIRGWAHGGGVSCAGDFWRTRVQ